MSSSNSGKKTRKRTVTSVPSTQGHPKYNEVLKVTPAALIVEIYATGSYDGPDTLLLHSTDGESASARTYHKELTVKDQEQSGKLIECSFTLSEQQGTAKTKGDLKDRRYTLVWRPTGPEGEEIVLFEDRPYEEAWNTGENRSVAASMITARFRECSNLEFPAEGGEPAVDLPETLKKEYKPFGDDRAAMYPTPETDVSEPAKSRSSSGESSSGGDSSGGGSSGGAVPGATPPKTAPPPGDRWIGIYGAFAQEMEEVAVEPRLLGAYKATQSGKYKRADLSGETPSASGPAQSDVLLPTGHVGTGAVDLFVRLAMGTPSSERFRQGAELLKSSGMDREDLILSVTPLFYGQPPPGKPPVPKKTGAHPLEPTATLRVHDPANHVGKAKNGPGSEVYLVNALWAAERRVRAAEAAAEAHQSWMKKTGWADGPSGLIGGLCYDPAHERGYLSDTLASAMESTPVAERDSDNRSGHRVTPALNMEKKWAPFSPDQVRESAEGRSGSEASRDLLGQFRYGLRCKTAFWAWNRQRAARRARILLGTSYFFHVVLDVYSGASAPQGRPRQLRELFVRLMKSGGHPPLSEAPDVLPEAKKEAEGEASLQEITQMPLTKALLKLGGKTAEAVHQLTLASAPDLLAVEASGGGGAPLGTRRLARALMGARHKQYQIEETAGAVRLHTGSPEAADVTLTKTSREAGRPARWELALSDEMQTKLEAATAGTSSALRLLNGLVAAAGVAGTMQNDTLGVGETIELAKLVVEGAALADESIDWSKGAKQVLEGSTALKVGRHLMALGGPLDALTAALDVHGALTDTDPRGQGEAVNPNPFGALGAVAGAAGGIAITAGSLPVAVAGGIGVLLGGGIAIATEIEDRLDVKEADPLSDWLPTESLWGKDASARGAGQSRTALLKAAGPPPTEGDPTKARVGGTPLKKALTDNMKTVTEQGFYFPTSVGVWAPDRGAAPTGLQLDIAVGYLPSYGTLMIDAAVNNRRAPEPSYVQCAVHYVSTDEGIQYRVVPQDDRLKLPNLENKSLSDWVSGKSAWTKAETSRLRLPNEEVIQAPHLPVRLGSWPDASEYREDKKAFAEKVLRIQKGRTGNRRTTIQNREQLRTVAASAPPATVLEGPSGFDSILQSGSFQVSGAVFFDPLTPLQPNPTIPDASASRDSQLLAREPIKFNYS